MVRLLVLLTDRSPEGIARLAQLATVRWVSKYGKPVAAIEVRAEDIGRLQQLTNVVRVQEERMVGLMG